MQQTVEIFGQQLKCYKDESNTRIFIDGVLKWHCLLNATQNSTTLYKAPSTELSKSLIEKNNQIFHHKGLFDFGVVKQFPRVDRLNKLNEKKLNQGAKLNKKMGGRSCFITSGDFSHDLLFRVKLSVLASNFQN